MHGSEDALADLAFDRISRHAIPSPRGKSRMGFTLALPSNDARRRTEWLLLSWFRRSLNGVEGLSARLRNTP